MRKLYKAESVLLLGFAMSLTSCGGGTSVASVVSSDNTSVTSGVSSVASSFASSGESSEEGSDDEPINPADFMKDVLTEYNDGKVTTPFGENLSLYADSELMVNADLTGLYDAGLLDAKEKLDGKAAVKGEASLSKDAASSYIANAEVTAKVSAKADTEKHDTETQTDKTTSEFILADANAKAEASDKVYLNGAVNYSLSDEAMPTKTEPKKKINAYSSFNLNSGINSIGTDVLKKIPALNLSTSTLQKVRSYIDLLTNMPFFNISAYHSQKYENYVLDIKANAFLFSFLSNTNLIDLLGAVGNQFGSTVSNVCEDLKELFSEAYLNFSNATNPEIEFLFAFNENYFPIGIEALFVFDGMEMQAKLSSSTELKRNTAMLSDDVSSSTSSETSSGSTSAENEKFTVAKFSKLDFSINLELSYGDKAKVLTPMTDAEKTAILTAEDAINLDDRKSE